MKISDTALELHDLVLRFVRRQRFVGLDFGVPSTEIGGQLGHTEQSVLFVLNAEEDKNVKDLAEIYGLERSWMSRVVAGLESKGYVASFTPEEDKRSKMLRLTKKGAIALDKVEQFVVGIMEECLKVLSAREVSSFQKYLSMFADGLGAIDYEEHGAGDPIGYQLGRISAVTGMYGKEVFGFELNLTQVQILCVLLELKGGDCLTSDIDGVVPFDMSTVSRVLQGFEKQGWISKVRCSQDKRAYRVSLTKAGDKLAQKYRKKVSEIIGKGLEAFSSKDLKDFLSLYARVAKPVPSILDVQGPIPFTLKPIEGNKRFRREKTTSDNREWFDQKLGLYEGGDLKGVIHLTRSRSTDSIRSFQFEGQEISAAHCMEMIQSCFAVDQPTRFK